VGGVVKEVPVVLGDHVKRGQPLVIIFSSELAEAETQYVSYLAELDAEHKKLERTQNLVKLGTASQQEEEEVAATHAAHESHVRAALEKLRLLGANDRQIAALKRAEQINPNLVVPAPINGVVPTRNANLGLVVNAGTGTLYGCRPLNGLDYGERQRKRLCIRPRRLAGKHHRSGLVRSQLEGPRQLH
jgi:membrane fusion protein, heavy metal efflux system